MKKGGHSQIQRTNCWLPGGRMMGRGITGIEEVRGTNYYVKNKLHGYTVQCGEYS